MQVEVVELALQDLILHLQQVVMVEQGNQLIFQEAVLPTLEEAEVVVVVELMQVDLVVQVEVEQEQDQVQQQ
jgi:hypothetical protein